MTQAEIDALLRTAFTQCDEKGCPLDDRQKQILTQVAESFLDLAAIAPTDNPLDALTDDQRQALLQFVVAQEEQGIRWRAALLNDWLRGQDSGSVQFIRDQYGPQWLNQVTDAHINQALNRDDTSRHLHVGDRIEVSNRLWEWVQEGTSCDETWFPCTVVNLSTLPVDSPSAEPSLTSIVRFENGMEYEIQGMTEWNAYNWRWPEG